MPHRVQVFNCRSNRIAWGKSYLKKAGYIHYPERGAVQITQKGKEVNKDKVNLKDIVNESGIFNFYKEEKTKGLEDLGDKRIITSRLDRLWIFSN